MAGLNADEPLFPKLAKRRTWLMVKLDLEGTGIPYETPEGIADFHAAGRHSHITGLLRNGATLPEAKELARHSDVRMTMKYTHIGLDDQANAIQRLPCQWIGSGSGVSASQSASVDDVKPDENEQPENDRNPGEDRGFVSLCQSESGIGNSPDTWRRREFTKKLTCHCVGWRNLFLNKGLRLMVIGVVFKLSEPLYGISEHADSLGAHLAISIDCAFNALPSGLSPVL